MPIHPLAVVDPQAEIHPDAIVGPFCHVRGPVRLAAGVELVSHVSILGRTSIGAGTRIFPGAVVGSDPQDLKFKGEDSEVRIGERCRLHECVTVSKGTATGGMLTSIGNDVLVMAYAHVAHDCHVADSVVIANNAQLAGHCSIGRKAIIGGMVGMHHFVTVGELAIISGMAGVRFDVPPYVMAEGNPAEPRNINIIGLRRDGWNEADIGDMREAFRDLYHDRGATPLREAVAEVRDRFEAKSPTSPVLRLCEWIENHLDNAVKGRMAEANRTAVVGGKANTGVTRPVICTGCGKEFQAQVRPDAHLAACTHCGRQQTVQPQA
ncbi:MAG: acyl-ACP--UDP-N-acetylglucosamine O-acyltransferase [Planctomycetes bacterium]|nr:acyl-ACP--UDP-N-acetylglucosamine O-acyltransferase [Planctomycetota bacterium]